MSRRAISLLLLALSTAALAACTNPTAPTSRPNLDDGYTVGN